MTERPGIALELPAPPSANRMYHIVRVRARGGTATIALTPEYRAWKQAAGWEVAALRKGRQAPSDGRPLVIEIYVCQSNHDIDNLIKPTLDALQLGGAIKNDRLVTEVTARRSHTVPGSRQMHVVVMWKP